METKRMTGQELAEQVSNFINVAMPDEKEEFARAVTSDHRTLQQDTFLLFLKCMEEWSQDYKDGRYDERNAFTCRASHKITEMVDNGI